MVIHAAISAVLRIVSCTVSFFICVDGHCSWDFASYAVQIISVFVCVGDESGWCPSWMIAGGSVWSVEFEATTNPVDAICNREDMFLPCCCVRASEDQSYS